MNDFELYFIQFSAGTIISEQFILTAAHCVTGDNTPIVVRLGIVSKMFRMGEFTLM